MDKHTPGPWLKAGCFVYALMHHGWAKGEETFRNRFSVHLQFDSSVSEEEKAATESLIAAAPELLEALNELMSDVLDIRGIDIEEYKPYALQCAREAIAKARGQQ